MPIIDAEFTNTEKEIDAEFEQSDVEMDAGFKIDYQIGVPGKSAYEVAVEEGFEGSKEEWLESLKGDPGEKGADGASVTVASVATSTADGGKNVVTFSDGKAMTVRNGSRGSQGPQGEPGSDATVTKENVEAALGYTPADAEEVERIDQGVNNAFESVWQSFEDAFNALSTLDEQVKANIDMVNHFDGDLADLTNGQKEINRELEELREEVESGGADGFSPIVDVSDIEGGHRVTVTDKDGAKAFDVMDGKDGQPGEKGDPGSDATVTKTNIVAALGYTPANSDEMWEHIESAEGRISDLENSMSVYSYEFSYWDNGDGTYEATGGHDYEAILEAYSYGYCIRVYTQNEDSLYEFNLSEICTDCIVFTSPEFEVRHYADGRWQMTKNSGTVHWNDIEDKPFGAEEVTVTEPLNITWDGNTEGMTVVQSLVEPSLAWAKVSDEVFTDEQIKAMSFVFAGIGDEPMHIAHDWDWMVGRGFVADDFVVAFSFGDPFVVFIRKAGVTFGEDADILSGVTFQEPGVYFFSVDAEVFTTSLEGDIPRTEIIVHTLDPKYLPMSDITAAVLSALPIYNGEVEEV